MCTLFDELELQILDAIAVEVIWDLCGTIDDICEFVDLQKLVILFGVTGTCVAVRLPR